MNKSKRDFENIIIAAVTVILLMFFVGISFDYYYDLNDDVLMKDILSGAYTGTPEGHNIQMLYLISAFTSFFYRIARNIPWYGILLCAFQYGSVLIIVQRTVSLLKNRWLKVALVIAEVSAMGSLMLMHLVNTQYTITVAMMASAALTYFVTTNNEKTCSSGEFIKRNIPAILIVGAAFLLRSEMLLLMLPFICVAGVLKWSFEDKIFEKKNVIGYLGVFGGILAALLIGQTTHMMAYGSKEWKTFTDLFNARTELYDYQVIPPYEGNESFYEESGISPEEQILFENYNFGMDDEIDNKTMWQVASYAGKLNVESRPFFEKLSGKIRIYIYEITHGPGQAGSDYPWNMVAGFLYVISAVAFVLIKKYRGILDLAFLFFIRTALWLYILMGERSPDRITHSLYFIEISVLMMCLYMAYINRKNEETPKRGIAAFSVCMLLLSALVWPGQYSFVKADQSGRENINKAYVELYDYMEAQDSSYFLVDVYSSVSYSEKIYGPMRKVSKANSDIMGGWACFSPLFEKKLAAYGFNNMEQALLEDNVYFVKKKDIDSTWLPEYYASHSKSIDMEMIKEIDGVFEIYAISGK